MDPGFYEMIELIEATRSGGSLAVLLAAARARFEAERLLYLERLIARRIAEVADRQSNVAMTERARLTPPDTYVQRAWPAAVDHVSR